MGGGGGGLAAARRAARHGAQHAPRERPLAALLNSGACRRNSRARRADFARFARRPRLASTSTADASTSRSSPRSRRVVEPERIYAKNLRRRREASTLARWWMQNNEVKEAAGAPHVLGANGGATRVHDVAETSSASLGRIFRSSIECTTSRCVGRRLTSRPSAAVFS